jgi:hypothetical protein
VLRTNQFDSWEHHSVFGDGVAMKKRKRKETTESKPKESTELTPDQVAELMASYEDSPEIAGIKFAPGAEEPDEEVVVEDLPLVAEIDFSEDDMVEIDLKAHSTPPR